MKVEMTFPIIKKEVLQVATLDVGTLIQGYLSGDIYIKLKGNLLSLCSGLETTGFGGEYRLLPAGTVVTLTV